MDRLSFEKLAIKYAANIEVMNSDFGQVEDPEKSELLQRIAKGSDQKIGGDLLEEFSKQVLYVNNIIYYDIKPRVVLLQPRINIGRNVFIGEGALEVIKKNMLLPKEEGLYTNNILLDNDPETGELVTKQITYELVYIETYNNVTDIPSKDQIIDRFTNSIDQLDNYYGRPLKDKDVVLISDKDLHMRAYCFEDKSFDELYNFKNRNLVNRAILNMDVGVEYELLKKMDYLGKILNVHLLSPNNYRHRYNELANNYLESIIYSDLKALLGKTNDYNNCYSMNRNDMIKKLNRADEHFDKHNYKGDLSLNNYSKLRESTRNKNSKRSDEWKSLINTKREQKVSIPVKKNIAPKEKSKE